MVNSKTPLQLQPAGVRFVGKGAAKAEKMHKAIKAKKLKAAQAQIEELKEQPAAVAEPTTEEEAVSAN